MIEKITKMSGLQFAAFVVVLIVAETISLSANAQQEHQSTDTYAKLNVINNEFDDRREIVDRQLNSVGDVASLMKLQQKIQNDDRVNDDYRYGIVSRSTQPKFELRRFGQLYSLGGNSDGPSGSSRSSYYFAPILADKSYRSLIDEYKHMSGLRNPLREGRAFKPRLMSTARGFGKRSLSRDADVGYQSFGREPVASVEASVSNDARLSGDTLR